ncbi:hypothetical protein DWB68_14240 [Galactobacter valiniphilus]|uniref:Uncharacterized protein n=1 Tax=Galactobacter valiniphilus TaxID=2676122 RepID=A0A399J7K9_9MICC|nr:hypothetical protein DWB68_14240 [Galactobacter valiniphilus]
MLWRRAARLGVIPTQPGHHGAREVAQPHARDAEQTGGPRGVPGQLKRVAGGQAGDPPRADDPQEGVAARARAAHADALAGEG